MSRSKKLSHQLSRYLGSETVEEDVLGLLSYLQDAKRDAFSPRVWEMLQNLPIFLDIVDASYQKYEDNLAVAERNIRLSSEELVMSNRSIKSMVNSLGQGFLMFDQTGTCSPIYSKACEYLLETVPAGRHIASVLRLDSEATSKFNGLLYLVFNGSHAMTFEDVMRFAPTEYKHSADVHVRLDYKADTTRDGRLDRVVVVATDITEQVRARELVEQRKALFESIERISHDRQSFGTFIRSVSEMTDSLYAEGEHMAWEALQREVHTMKGGAGMFRLNGLVEKIHSLETAMKPFVADDIYSIPSPRDPCFAVLSEHGNLIRAELESLSAYLKELLGLDVNKAEVESSFDKKILYDFAHYLNQLGLGDVRHEYIRMVCAESLRTYLQRYDLVLGDLAARLNKQIHPIQFTGPDIPIVIDTYRELFESFVHLFRNIIDHGIEPPDNRRMEGKDEAGTVVVDMKLDERAFKKVWLCLDIHDDGAGVDVPRLREKLAAKEPDKNWKERTEAEVLEGLLTRNISTCDSISIYSGRGTGIRAVYVEVATFGGYMSLKSEAGKGVIYHIEIPYDLEWNDSDVDVVRQKGKKHKLVT